MFQFKFSDAEPDTKISAQEEKKKLRQFIKSNDAYIRRMQSRDCEGNIAHLKNLSGTIKVLGSVSHH